MIFLWYAIAFFLSLTLTGLLWSHAHKLITLDIPNERSSHTKPTPRGGGISIILSFCFTGFCMAFMGVIPYTLYFAICIPSFIVAFIGLADDLWTISPWIRLIVHCAAALLFFYFSHNQIQDQWIGREGIFGFFEYMLLVLGLVWCVNLNNFMDGIDGIASVEAISVVGGAALIFWVRGGESDFVIIQLLLVVAILGFLAWNWPPAKIFMGDACSGFLGFMIAVLALLTYAAGEISIWSWLILYGVFIVDATYTLLRRIVIGAKFYEAHRSHAYQIISRILGSHQKVTMGILVMNMVWLFPLAFVASSYPHLSVYCFVGAYLPLIMIAFKTGAGTAHK